MVFYRGREYLLRRVRVNVAWAYLPVIGMGRGHLDAKKPPNSWPPMDADKRLSAAPTYFFSSLLA